MTRNKEMQKLHDVAEKTVIGALQDMGFTVARIATSDEHRTADLLATKGGETHTVEVTTKSDSGEFDKTLKRGETAESMRIEQHSSTIQRVIRGKKQQVRATGTGGFGVLWIEAIGPFGEDIVEEIVATFFGSVSVPERQAGGKNLGKPCYFYDQAECFKHTELNAVIAAHNGEARLLLNPEAPNADAFRASALVAAFSPGVVDPPAEEARGRCFSLRSYTGERAPTPENDRARNKALGEKYPHLTMPLGLRMRRMMVAKHIPFDVLAERLAKQNAAPDAEGEAT